MQSRLLLVDESQELRARVRALLESSGLFEVVGEAADSRAGWMLAEQVRPEVVLLGTSAAERDGVDELPSITVVSPASVLVMYGPGEPGLSDDARSLGAADLIDASLPVEEVPRRLQEVLADHAAGAGPGGGAEGAEGAEGGGGATAGSDKDAELTQAALLDQYERFREAFARAAIGMAILSLSGRIVRANAAFAALVGSPLPALPRVHYSALTVDAGTRFDEALAKALQSLGEAVCFEHRLPAAGTEERTVSAMLTPVLDADGHPLYLFVQLQDVTAQVALRRSEELFRLLVTTVKDYAIYMLDTEGTIASWNAGAERIKGYRAEEVLGRHFRLLYREEDRRLEHPEQSLRLALEHGSYAEEGWRVRRDGSRFWASVLITAVYDDEGRHWGFAEVTRDQTGQRALQEELRRAIEQQAHVLAVTAHELRTPAAVIDGAAMLLLETAAERGDAASKKLLEAVASTGLRLQRLAADLAAAAAVQTDALTLETGQVQLSQLLASAVGRLRTIHPAARLSLRVDQDVEFTADAGRLGQAVDNLIGNAVRHGRAPIEVKGEATPDGVRICVSDEGPGVESRLRERLFERFAHAGPHAGSGLGLHLVREIARSHGGEVTYLPPALNRRTTFMVELPRTPSPPTSTGDQRSETTGPTGTSPD